MQSKHQALWPYSWCLYGVLIVLRVTCMLLPGYIHPDEFFQGGQELFFGNNLTTANFPWEFQKQHAVRSIFPPTFMTFAPLRLYTWRLMTDNNNNSRVIWKERLSGMEILLVPRLFLALLSIFAMDVSVWYMATTVKRQTNDNTSVGPKLKKKWMLFLPGVVPMEVLVLASAWPTLVFMNRPFTNSLESMCLSLLLALVVYDINETAKFRNAVCAGVGILCGLGVFIRFTFLIFAAPAVLFMILSRGRKCDIQQQLQIHKVNDMEQDVQDSHKGFCLVTMVIFLALLNLLVTAEMSSVTTVTAMLIFASFLVYARRHLKRKMLSRYRSDQAMIVVNSVVWITVFFHLTAFGVIYMDTMFYSSLPCNSTINESQTLSLFDQRNDCSRQSWFITPWNALLYNIQKENLKEHGIHPRITHGAVNMHLLFGPLSILFYLALVKDVVMFFQSRYSHDDGYESGVVKVITNHNVGTLVMVMCRTVILTGLGALSLAPHQEPRFLLPLLTPLTLLHGRDVISLLSKRSRSIILWVLFNLLLLLFFGLLHQAGIIPCLLSIPTVSVKGKLFPGTVPFDEQSVMIWYHTYMPPTFLAQKAKYRNYPNETTAEGPAATSCSATFGQKTFADDFKGYTFSNHETLAMNEETITDFNIVDLKGSDFNTLIQELNMHLQCGPVTNNSLDAAAGDYSRSRFVFLVMPLAISKNYATTQCNNEAATVSDNFSESTMTTRQCWNGFLHRRVQSYHPHLSTEDIPDLDQFFWTNLELTTFVVTCQSL